VTSISEFFLDRLKNLVDHLSPPSLRNAEDIDLLVGALMEEPVVGALFGPTISCLLAQQFELLKQTDRFWYENEIPPSSFSLEQLKSIRQTTLSGLLCGSNQVETAQSKAFIREDNYL